MSNRILIVKNNPTEVAHLKSALENHGYQVSIATNGREALAKVGASRPTGIISDISTYANWVKQNRMLVETQDELEASNEQLRREIGQRQRFEEELAYLTSRDPLTGLFNRRQFEEQLEQQIAYASRYGVPGALLWLDLDGFKVINDSLGHKAGDDLLRSVGNRLMSKMRRSDILARLGGDEFAILLPHTDEQYVQRVSIRTLQDIRQHVVVIDGQPVRITASIGIVLFPEQGVTAQEVLTRADIAMYQAKAEGRNRVCLYRPDADQQAVLETRLAWVRRIREALENDEFMLYAQPILNIKTGQISGYEALLRLKGERDEVIPPGVFLDIAERSGLISDIDRWVVRRALNHIAQARAAGQSLRLAVNLSVRSLADMELLELIKSEPTLESIDPVRLVLEVTETAAISNMSTTTKFVGGLKGQGYQFALDDFGKGFSSFYHLKHLEVDYLKIDGCFVRDLPRDAVDQHLVQAMVHVAQALGKDTIAEFVGDEVTLEMLRGYGVDYAQGYYIGRPRPMSEVLPK